MKFKLTQVPISEPEILEIKYHTINEDIQEIVSFIKNRQGVLNGKKDGNIAEIPVCDVFYINSVDNRTYLYTADNCYEIGMRIYEIEEILNKSTFVRIQKGTILNLMKISSIKPGLSGRYSVHLKNKEEIIVSRKYVPEFKQKLKGDCCNETKR